MAGVLTKKFEVDISQQFIDDVKQANNTYFIFTAKSTPWSDDNNPPLANTAQNSYDQSVYENILYGKRITENDVSLLIRRVDWANNTSYAEYNKDDENLYDKNFYVYNPNNKAVYKVIEAGSGNSVVIPSIISTNNFKTSDGYLWKYMFTVQESSMKKFGSNTYIPVNSNSTIENSAIPGSIESIKVIDGGEGWLAYHTGTIQNIVNNSVITISANASSFSDFYVGSTIYLKSGLGSGQIRDIIDYDGASKRIVVNPAMDININLILSNISGQFFVGDTVTQNLIALSIISQSGYIQPGDTINQLNGATGRIVTANTSYLKVIPLSSLEFQINTPIDGGRGQTTGNSTVTVAAGNTTITAAANALFSTFYTVGDYIKLGNTTVWEIQRISSIANNTSLTVSSPFTSAFTTKNHFKMASGATVASITNLTTSGTVKFVDVSSVELDIANSVGNFDLGEVVTQANTTSNGIISFANSSKLIITNITGPGFQASNTTYQFPIVGLYSNSVANVTYVTSNPTITLSSNSTPFLLGTTVTSSSGASADVTGFKYLPNEQTEYIISPKVNIDGDGSDALAYSIVNTATQSISSIMVFNTGSGYTEANVTITSNNMYGNGVSLKSLISPVKGHGSNAAYELGASYVSVTTTFGNTYNEQYNLPGYGTFRIVGLLKNPLFDNVYLTVNNYSRTTVGMVGANTFQVGEVIHQPNNATGLVVYSTTSQMELENVRGTFNPAAANNVLAGLSSDNFSFITTANVNYFIVGNNSKVKQEDTLAYGDLISTNNSVIRLTNVGGVFSTNKVVYDSSSNAYATVTDIKTLNNTKTLNFSIFNQTSRISLSQSSGNFVENEIVEFRTQPTNVKIGSAIVYNSNNDIDILYSGNTTNFLTNEVINCSTGASAILLAANSTQLKLTNVVGTFLDSTTILGQSSGANGTISETLRVINVTGINGILSESEQTMIVGLESNSTGYASFANTITKPNLVKNSGDVLYIENTAQPIEKTETSTETVNIVLKF